MLTWGTAGGWDPAGTATDGLAAYSQISFDWVVTGCSHHWQGASKCKAVNLLLQAVMVVPMVRSTFAFTTVVISVQH